jgi:hypothetical protein
MTITFFDAIPAANNNPSADQPLMLLDNIGLNAIWAVNHRTFNMAASGQHTSIQFDQNASYVPTPPVTPPQLFTDIVSGLPQLKYYSGNAAHSSDQYTPSTANFSTMLLAGMILKGGSFTTTTMINVVDYSTLTPPLNPFPNNTLAVVLTSINTTASSATYRVTAVSPTTFTVTTNAGGLGSQFYFIAIGF